MVRIGLTANLILVVLAGPWLCCCSAANLASALEERPQPACSHQGCCHAQQSGKTSPQPEKPNPQKPCPCQERQLPSVPVKTLDSEVVKHLHAVQQDIVEFSVLASQPEVSDRVEAGQRSDESTAFPFLTSRDILSRLQALLC